MSPNDSAITLDQTPQRILAQMISDGWVAQAVYAAAKLGIPDLLQAGARTPADLAAATGTHARSLYRLLRALASFGLFVEKPDGTFALTPLGAGLTSAAPGSQRAVAILAGEEQHRAWGEILYSLRTGKPAFEHVYGQPLFAYLAEHPEQARTFDAAMTGVHGPETRAMLNAYSLSGVRTLVDVGGGNGSTLCGVLARYPGLKGVLFDRPDVVERARANLDAAGLADRCTTVGGSFFESVPPGGDAYLLRRVIHDWDDEQALAILRNCRKAMTASARLLVVESVIPPGNNPSFGKLLDLVMLVMPGGLERTEAEYRQLYRDAGFRLTRVVPTDHEVSVIEGAPA
jgi:hypothetical protein